MNATVVRLTDSGTPDDSFGSATGAHIDVNDGFENVESIALLRHGGVVAAGYLDGGRSFLVKLRKTGAPDGAMGPGGVKVLPDSVFDQTTRVAALSDGRIVAVANSSESTGIAYRLLGDLKPRSCAGKKATIVGTQASDHLVGTGRVDVIAGLGGADKITGLGRGDLVCGGRGRDRISGGVGSDKLYGQAGRDVLSGGKGRDKLVGGAGHDILHGGPGHDTVRQ